MYGIIRKTPVFDGRDAIVSTRVSLVRVLENRSYALAVCARLPERVEGFADDLEFAVVDLSSPYWDEVRPLHLMYPTVYAPDTSPDAIPF